MFTIDKLIAALIKQVSTIFFYDVHFRLGLEMAGCVTCTPIPEEFFVPFAKPGARHGVLRESWVLHDCDQLD